MVPGYDVRHMIPLLEVRELFGNGTAKQARTWYHNIPNDSKPDKIQPHLGVERFASAHYLIEIA